VTWAQELPLPDAILDEWVTRFSSEVDHRLDVPLTEQKQYADLLTQALGDVDPTNTAPQSYVLVDRNPNIQALMLLVHNSSGWHWIGATAVSTGKTGTYDHFLTPIGRFAHTLDNPDFRAEGTFNQNKIRGYGLKGMRVFDFGWQSAERGWGDGGTSLMRLQMHATDPATLEKRLGTVQSEGCVRIPASLNRFLDHYGVLDAQYEESALVGEKNWILPKDRHPIPWPGRYLVVVDSGTSERPTWALLPKRR
jgi:hypothetical protein